jgi:hypothetical protein
MIIIKPKEIANIVEALYEQGEFDSQHYAILTLSKLAEMGIDEELFSPHSAIISDANEWRKDHQIDPRD